MRKGTGLNSVERALILQASAVSLIDGDQVRAQVTYREFGERLPGRVRDFSGLIEVRVEVVAPQRVRLSFTNVLLAGPAGSASFTGHLEFSTP